jgi:uncharacterized membrane protein YedE/YeeE
MRVESPGKLLLGLGTGVMFGALLQKGRAAKYEVIADQLLLKDATVAKIMGTAIVVGAAGVQVLVQTGHAALDVKPLRLLAVTTGAVMFGSGLAVIGYCPGTTLAAIGEGRRDAIAGALGMLAGAALFVRAFPQLKPALDVGDRGKTTLPKATRTSPWPWIAGMAATLVAAAAYGALRGSRR